MAARTLMRMIGSAGVAFAIFACGDGSDAVGKEVPDATVDGCRPPPGATALCLTFSPEAITPESDPRLDGRGSFRVQVFDRPTPPPGDVASSVALYEKTFPDDFATGGEISIADVAALPAPTVVLSDPPSEVYVRGLFFDNAGVFANGGAGFDWGTWLGGSDLASGVASIGTLQPVQLAAGQVTMHDVPMVAMRRLTATVTTSVTPLGDGEGALSVFASRVAKLPPAAPTYAYGIDPCVDVTRGPHTVEMFLIGSGTLFVAASFEGLGIETPGAMPPGTLISLRDFDPETGDGTFDQITVEDDQYVAAVSLDLGSMSPFDGDPAALGPNSCKDLGLPGEP